MRRCKILSLGVTALASAAIAVGNRSEVYADTMHDYWAQFGAEHATVLPVAEWLSLYDENSVLWEGTLGEVALNLKWNHFDGVVEVLLDGEPVSVVTSLDSGGRPTWTASSGNLGGFIDVDEANGRVILQIETGGDIYRMMALEPHCDSVEVATSTDTLLLDPATCVCFGTGTQNRICSEEDCNNVIPCTASGSKRCKWKSGGAE